MIEFTRKVGKRCNPDDPPQPGDLIIGKYKGNSCDGTVYRVVEVPWWDMDSVSVVSLMYKSGVASRYAEDPYYADGTGRNTGTIKIRLCCHYELGVERL